MTYEGLTSKEFAEQLIDEFMQIKSMKLSDYSLVYYPFAKLSALVAIRKMIEWCDVESQPFLEKVEQELINL